MAERRHTDDARDPRGRAHATRPHVTRADGRGARAPHRRRARGPRARIGHGVIARVPHPDAARTSHLVFIDNASRCDG